MNINVTGKKVFVGGIQGSGKTQFTRVLVSTKFKNAITLRISDDYDDLKNITQVDAFYLSAKQQKELFENMCGEIVKLAKAFKDGKIAKMPYDCLLIEEADLFVQNNFDIGANLNHLILMHRHYDLSLIMVSRRPQDIPARVLESSHYLFLFKIQGNNVMKYLGNIDSTIPNIMEEKVSFKRHNYIMKELGEKPQLMNPIKSKFIKHHKVQR